MNKKHITSAVIIVIKKDGKYLLTYRVEKDPEHSAHNIWQIPGGGVEFGETLEQSLRREAKEELGLEIKIVKKLPKVYEIIRNDFHGIFHGYLCAMNNENDQIILNEEASEFKWFLPEEIKTLHAFPEVYNVIRSAEDLL